MPESTGPGPDGAPLRRVGELSVTTGGACRVQVERVVRLASDTSGEGRVAAVGRIATGDGWVVALEQTSRTSGASGAVEERLRLTRQDEPSCPSGEIGGTPA
jgi:hypothetical protein